MRGWGHPRIPEPDGAREWDGLQRGQLWRRLGLAPMLQSRLPFAVQFARPCRLVTSLARDEDHVEWPAPAYYPNMLSIEKDDSN